MNTIQRLTPALGRPHTLREVGGSDQRLAAVGRWRHQGACVDLSGTDTVQLVFNVSGGQLVELRSGDRSVRRVVRAGSIGIVSPGIPTKVAVAGSADTVQIIIGQAFIVTIAGGPASLSPSRFAGSEAELQAVAAQALVALARGRQESRLALNRIVRRVAGWFARPVVATPSAPARGSLSPSARRRVHALMDERLRPDECSPLALGEPAHAAGLSVQHFVQAFRQTEGRTPYASVLARRLDLALALLLQPGARVDWIAGQTGFSSPAHFVSAFYGRLGVTPGALRDAADPRK